MNDSRLDTVASVIDALGGPHAVLALTGARYTALCNWRKAGNFPPDTYKLMTDALAARGNSAPARLWRQRENGTAERTRAQEALKQRSGSADEHA
jgi:hypothetical protein